MNNSKSAYMGQPAMSVSEKRLQILNKMNDAGTQQLLSQLMLPKNPKVLNVECRDAHTSVLLKQHFKDAKVTAITASEIFYQQAVATLQKNDAAEIELKQLSPNQLMELDQTFDVVYARMMLSNQTNPTAIIDDCFKILKPGGYLVFEEPTTSKNFCHPAQPAFKQLFDLLEQTAQHNHINLEIGRTLPEILEAQCEKPIYISYHQGSCLSQEDKMIGLYLLEELTSKFLSVTSEQVLKELAAEYEKTVVNNSAVFLGGPRMTQIIVQKQEK